MMNVSKMIGSGSVFAVSYVLDAGSKADAGKTIVNRKKNPIITSMYWNISCCREPAAV